MSLTGAQGLTAAVVVGLHAKDGWDTSSGAQALRQVGGPRAVGMHVAAVPVGHLLHKTQNQDISHSNIFLPFAFATFESLQQQSQGQNSQAVQVATSLGFERHDFDLVIIQQWISMTSYKLACVPII